MYQRHKRIYVFTVLEKQPSADVFQVGVLKKSTVFKPSDLIKKMHLHRCFPLNIAKFLRTAFFIEDLGWLFLRRFLLKRVADLVRVCFLHVILVETIPTRFC